jgi:hypothetical protein
MNPDRSADNQPPESAADDSFVKEVFEALEVTGATTGQPVPDEVPAEDDADNVLEDSFRAEADESLIDAAGGHLDELDDEAGASAVGYGAVPQGLRSFFGLVGGSLLAVAAALLILMWGLGRDPFGVSTRLPERLAFLLPPAFRGDADRTSAPDQEGVVAAGDTVGSRD